MKTKLQHYKEIAYQLKIGGLQQYPEMVKALEKLKKEVKN